MERGTVMWLHEAEIHLAIGCLSLGAAAGMALAAVIGRWNRK